MTDNKLRIVTGKSDFRELITTSDVYVDQTLFVKEFLDSGEAVTLITRPRRWGKSLVLDIANKFFTLEVYKNGTAIVGNSNRVLFEGGEVTVGEEKIQLPKSKLAQKWPEYIEKYQGRYPVIYIDFQDVKASTYSEIENKFNFAIKGLYRKHKYLAKSDILDEDQKATFVEHLKGISEKTELHESLKFLTELLRTHHGKKVIVLVDEYDRPVNNLLSNAETFDDKALRDKVVDLLSSILTPCGKGNDANLEKMLMVGIFDTVKKTNSGFNNVQAYGINDVAYGQHFGFSEAEVGELIAQLGFNDTATQHIQRWYNGYNIPTFGRATIRAYAPWAVMNYLQTAYIRGDFKPKSYWITSGASDILERLLNVESCVNGTISRKLVALTKSSESVELSFSSSASLLRYDLRDATEDEIIFSYLLLNSGYLTVSEEGERYMFRVPNAEVQEEFANVASLAVKHATQGIPNFCRKILDNLNKPKHIKAIKAMKDGNSKDLEHLFKSPGSLRCEDEALHFNYFHIAAIHGNEKIFGVLLENCETNLLRAHDDYNLQPIDYAYMLNRSTIMHYFSGEVPLSKPQLLSSLFCEPHAQALFAGISGIAAMSIGLCVPTSASLKAFLVVGAGVTGAVTAYSNYVAEKIEKTFNCVDYQRYSSIDVSTMERLQPITPGQFLKYRAIHQEAYVVNSTHCSEGDKLVNQKLFQIFKDGHYADEALSLSMCNKTIVGNIAVQSSDTEL